MKDLSRHIEYLLSETDSVSLTGIGVFVTKELPAKYCGEECLFLPPVRSVCLDTLNTEDDGKLENCLVSLHRVSHATAKKWIEEYLTDVHQSLLDLGYMDLGTIGRLVLCGEEVLFEACEAGVNSTEFYGLDSFHMTRLPAHAFKGRHTTDGTHVTIRLRKSTIHRWMTAAAIIIVALFVVAPNYGTFFSPGSKSQAASAESILSLLSVNPQPIAASATSEPQQEVEVVPSEEQDIEVATAQGYNAEVATGELQNAEVAPAVEQAQAVVSMDALTAAEPAQPKLPAVEEKEQATVSPSGYCVVMASAITHKGANSLIRKLAAEGFDNAVEVNDKGMLRVVLTGYLNEEAARAAMALVKSTDKLYSGSWIKQF